MYWILGVQVIVWNIQIVDIICAFYLFLKHLPLQVEKCIVTLLTKVEEIILEVHLVHPHIVVLLECEVGVQELCMLPLLSREYWFLVVLSKINVLFNHTLLNLNIIHIFIDFFLRLTNSWIRFRRIETLKGFKLEILGVQAASVGIDDQVFVVDIWTQNRIPLVTAIDVLCKFIQAEIFSCAVSSVKGFCVKCRCFEIVCKLDEVKLNVLICFLIHVKRSLSTSLLIDYVKHKHVCFILVMNISRFFKNCLFRVEQLVVILVPKTSVCELSNIVEKHKFYQDRAESSDPSFVHWAASLEG